MATNSKDLKFNDVFAKLNRNDSATTSIDLTDVTLTDLQIQVLCTALRKNTFVISIELGNISLAGLKSIQAIFEKDPSTKEPPNETLCDIEWGIERGKDRVWKTKYIPTEAKKFSTFDEDIKNARKVAETAIVKLVGESDAPGYLTFVDYSNKELEKRNAENDKQLAMLRSRLVVLISKGKNTTATEKSQINLYKKDMTRLTTEVAIMSLAREFIKEKEKAIQKKTAF